MPNAKAFTLWLPNNRQPQPLVFDSPHSSDFFPAHPQLNASADQLKSGWDAYVDELWLPATQKGASLLAANFSRMYIDPNRAVEDIDESLLDAPWPYALKPTAYSRRGMGLIRRDALPEVPMYKGLLSVEDVRSRITNYYAPYHQQLRDLLEPTQYGSSQVWHVNCHSMKSTGNAMNIDAGQARPDVVVSDALGTTANPAFTACVAESFRSLGLQVAVNDPYQGGFVVREYGRPQTGVHSIQIELNRALYMHEASYQKSAQFAHLQHQLTRVTEAILGFIQTQS